MAEVEELLAPLAEAAQKEIQSRLRGLLGGMLRHYLPQIWVFRTDRGTASLTVTAEGVAGVTGGALAPADVTIDIGHERLAAALATLAGKGKPPAPGGLKVTTHSAKGRAAFDYLRARIGL